MVSEQRIFQAYYTNSESIVSYMVDLLDLNGTETIFEPCAGDGVFIDPILDKYQNIQIDAFELNESACANLKSKYQDLENISIKQTDTLTDLDLELLCSIGGKYDAVIANPPYGAWRNPIDRATLKKRFNGFYAKESYSLFLYRSIESLNEGGKLVFIIPDTYLNLNMHKDIRKYILSNTKIKEIALFPSSYFPGVNFGYANLSIIALEKSSDYKSNIENKFEIIKDYKSVEELGNNKLKHLTKLNIKQKNVLNNQGYTFLINANPNVSDCIKQTKKRIGDICECVTGFYSGNDKERLKVLSKEIRNSKRYDEVDKEKITYDCSIRPLDGINNEKIYVPIVKGGNVRYYKTDNWFMEWSIDSVSFYKKDKKARYQNASFYFKRGIAVPMVSSSAITGAIIENRLFDQSIVGIFPKEENLIYYLLAFFNSPTCNRLIRTINPSTNNSSNYIKRIPFIQPSTEQEKTITKNINQIIEQVKISGDYNVSLEAENSNIIAELYGF
ncbi:modification methylase VspI [Kordia sp. SMS9]|uniref:Eco57I restriction-modification methylase domain-containing protein n=1 Tax=Kordia sp. SMS9 TaxID=2282170 RepID=UPI000E0D29CA|nr:N-6 DNA methylase [Kordia sp. SMS9]AXG70478.1 modification methylase VspI [Kordia sp. SMS9]